MLAVDLIDIDWCLKITTMFDGILRAVDKEFSLPENYPKGHGDMFKHWLPKYHPGVLLVHIQRTAGSCQDLATKGASAMYWNRIYYIEFLDEGLQGTKDNILQENLFVVLTSVEMVTLSHVLVILHFKVCMPLKWLAGNIHFIGQQGCDLSTRSMGKAIDGN